MSWRAGIHGYVARWNVVTGIVGRPHAPHLARPCRYEPDCFTYDATQVEVWFMHRQAQNFGRGAELGLRLWSDSYGLAFAFTPPLTAFSLVCGIAESRYDQCSAGFVMDAKTTEQQGNILFDSISRATLTEISICPRGACPGAICWHIGNGPRAISPAARELLPIWEGRSFAQRRTGAVYG